MGQEEEEEEGGDGVDGVLVGCHVFFLFALGRDLFF